MKKLLIYMLGLFGFVILFGIAFFVVYPAIDRAICIRQVSARIGTEPTYENIIMSIRSTLVPGMSRSEVETILKNYGSLEIHREEVWYGEPRPDSIWINMCAYPFNNFWIYAYYSYYGKLESFDIDWDWGSD